MKFLSFIVPVVLLANLSGVPPMNSFDHLRSTASFDCDFFLQAGSDSSGLDAVLKKMDTAAASFRTTRAEFEWDRYEKVINEVDDIQSGTIYYRRVGKDIKMMGDITKPDRKNV